TKRHANGRVALWESDGKLFLSSSGATSKGDRPLLARFDLVSKKSEELFRCGEGVFETANPLTDDASKLLIRRESPTDPGNYFVRSAGKDTAITTFTDPAPQLRGIKKQLVTTKRADGVPISFTLYLPPDYKEGEKRPTLFWAYPREFNSADTAGQVSGNTSRFTMIGSYSHLFLLMQGYVVMDEVSVPIVGPPETANNTFLEQLVASAKAAIDKAVDMGPVDRDRIGVGGHSYGAFMTANLLAHSDLFRAGVARSGAYNRTLTPFGFQNERRTFWEAPEIYAAMSPFNNAQKINEPILLIHGAADDNPGTFPVQSERLYAAIRGNGGTSRLVMLPNEAHSYVARETIEHVLAETIDWFEKHVKNAPPRDGSLRGTSSSTKSRTLP
ncbi:MAG: alpha/beta hydrolase family protein, partial [Gemmataceae bacterium]